MRGGVAPLLCLALLGATPPAAAPGAASRDEAVAVLRQALAYRPAYLGNDGRPCVYLRLESPDSAAGAPSPFDPPLDRIDTAWLTPGTPVTGAIYGCARTLAYFWPTFDFQAFEGRRYQTANVRIDGLCGPMCGESGSVSFARVVGARDWRLIGYDQHAVY